MGKLVPKVFFFGRDDLASQAPSLDVLLDTHNNAR